MNKLERKIYPKRILEERGVVDARSLREDGDSVLLVYGVPYEDKVYVREEQIEEDPLDWEERAFHAAQDRVEALARDGKTGAIILSYYKEDRYFYEIFRPKGD